METKKDRTALIALIAGAVALLLGLCLGALAGGVAGYVVGRQTGERVSVSDVTEDELGPGWAPQLPAIPEIPEMPQIPMITNGALIREVIADSPAAKAGLLAGDLITGINAIPINAEHPLADVVRGFQPGDRVEVKIRRAGETLTLNLTLGKHPDNPSQAYVGVYYADASMRMQRPSD